MLGMAQCLTCGSNEARQKFCSQSCAKKYHNSRRPRARKLPVKCAGCGLVFEGRPDQKTCSSTCRSRIERGSKTVRVKVPKRVPKTGLKLSEISSEFAPKNVPNDGQK